jgi:hypothetical protein
VSDADGTLHWLKPAQAKAEAYQSGFDTDVPVVVSAYPGTSLLGRSGTMTLGGGTLTAEIDNDVTIPVTGGAFLIGAGDVGSLKMSVNAKTGLLTGSFIPGADASPEDLKTRKLNGVLFPKQEAGAGLFMQPFGTGRFEIDLTVHP